MLRHQYMHSTYIVNDDGSLACYVVMSNCRSYGKLLFHCLSVGEKQMKPRESSSLCLLVTHPYMPLQQHTSQEITCSSKSHYKNNLFPGNRYMPVQHTLQAPTRSQIFNIKKELVRSLICLHCRWEFMHTAGRSSTQSLPLARKETWQYSRSGRWAHASSSE